jgi:trigger factor
MEFLIENQQSPIGILKVKVVENDYQEKLKNSLKNYAKKVQMPGFRPGMAPIGMITKMYGKSFLVEEVNQLLNHEVQNYISAQDFSILGYPLPIGNDADINWDTQKDFEFEFEFAFEPKIEYDLKKSKFEKRQIQITQELLDDENKAKTLSNGNEKEIENITEDSFLTINIEFKNTENIVTKDIAFLVKNIVDKELQNSLLGMAVGNTFETIGSKIFDANQLSYRLRLEENENHLANETFTATITKITEIEAAELNEDFFKKIFGEECTTQEQYFERIKNTLEAQYEKASVSILRNEIMKQLVEKNTQELPKEFLIKWLQSANEKKLDQNELESNWKLYENGFKWEIIQKQLSEEYKIEYDSKSELESYFKQSLIDMFSQYSNSSLNSLSDDMLGGYVKNMMGNNEEVKKALRIINENHVLDKVISVVEPQTVYYEAKDFYNNI